MEAEKKLLSRNESNERNSAFGGWAGWLMARLRTKRRPEPRLQLLERITLAPRQSLALVEADGKRLLVATSADGGPAFYPLDARAGEYVHRELSRKAVRRSC